MSSFFNDDSFLGTAPEEATAAPTPGDEFGVAMRARLAEAESTRDALMAQYRTASDTIARMLKRPPRRPAGNPDRLDAEIEDLEYEIQTMSLSLTQEKGRLREIADVKKRRSAYTEYGTWQATLDGLKAERADLDVKIKAAIAQCRELKDGVKTVDIADRLRADNPGVDVSAADVVSQEISVPTAMLGRIIGKAGAVAKALEQEMGVTLDVTRGKEESTLKLRGLPDGVARAVVKVDELTGTDEETVPLEPGLANLLMTNAGAGIKQLELHTGARARLHRKTADKAPSVQLTGRQRCIDAAKAWMAAVYASRGVITVSTRTIPSLIGTKGEHYKAIQEAHGVTIDNERGDGTSTDVVVWGVEPEAVEAAKADLLALVDRFTEHEETLAIDAGMISWLVGNGAARIKAFQKAAGILANVRRAPAPAAAGAGAGDDDDDAAPEAAPSDGPTGADAWLALRGSTENLAKAREAFVGLKAEFDTQNIVVGVNTAQARAVIGSSGETVKRLRAETGASIDVDVGADGGGGGGGRRGGRGGRPRFDAVRLAPGKGLVRIQSADPDKLAAAHAAVNAIIEAFTQQEFTVNDEVIGSLIGRGGGTITKLQADTGTNIDVAKGSVVPETGLRGVGVVTVSGPEEGVATAAAAIEKLVEENHLVVVPLPEGDVVAAIIGKGGEAIKKLQADTGATLDVDKRRGHIRVRGTEEAAAAGAAALTDTIERFTKENATLRVPTDTVPGLIGRAGANVKALQEATGATLDVSSRTGVVRVRGPEEAVKAAVAAITEACGLDKAWVEVPYDDRALGTFLGRNGANVRALSEEHDVVISVNRGKSTVVIRGEQDAVDAAKGVVTQQLADAIWVEESVAMPVDRLGTLMGARGTRIRALQDDTGATIDVPRSSGPRVARTVPVKIKGGEAAVAQAKLLVEAIARGKATATLRLQPVHVEALAGRLSRNVERLRLVESATINVNTTTANVVITSDEDAIGKVTAAVERLLMFTFGDEYVIVPVPTSLFGALEGDRAAGRGRKKKGGKAAAGASAAGDDDATNTSPGDVDSKDGETKEAPAADAAFVTLPQLKDATGANVFLNRDGGYVSVSGAEPQVAAAKAALEAMLEAHAERNADVRVEGWMVPFIVGSKGAAITALEAETGAKLKVDRDRGVVQVSADSREGLESAKGVVDALVARLAAQRIIIPVSDLGMRVIIGKGGSTIRRLQEESGAAIDLDREAGTAVLRGQDADAVAKCKELVEALLEEAGAAGGAEGAEKRFKIERGDAPAIIGAKGAGIRGIEADTGASVKVDKDSNMVIVRGDSEDAVEAAVVAIKKVCAANKVSRRDEGGGGDDRKGKKNEPSANTGPSRKSVVLPLGAVPIGAAPSTVEAAARTKAARRRERKKAERFADPGVRADGIEWGAGSADVLSALTAPPMVITPTGRKVAPPPGLSAPAAPPVPPPAASSSEAFALLGLSATGAPTGRPAAASQTSAPGSDYYVSSSGFSVRL